MIELTPIIEALRRLVRRQRTLAVVCGALASMAGLLVLWSGALGLAAGGVDRFTSRRVLVAALVVLVATGLWRLVVSWRSAGDLRRQAERVEAERPALRGRLFVLLDRRGGLLAGDSASLLELAQARAMAAIEGLLPNQIHPVQQLRPFVAVAGVAGLGWFIAALIAPMGPIDTLAWLGGEARAITVAELDETVQVLPTALLGDITLEYTYPEYTGLPAFVVPNSNGTIHGPPGTSVRITARTAERYDAAALQYGEGAPDEAELDGGRDLSGTLVISMDGVYRFILQRGAGRAVSPDFAVVVEPDNPPVVDVVAPSDRLEVTLDEIIQLEWSARDDFGLAAITAVVRRKGIPLEGGDRRIPTQWAGELGLSAADLGLRPGDDVALTIDAWDNDQATGSKSGRSRPIRVLVIGEDAERIRFIRFRRELRDALIDVLADFATDPEPVAETRGGLVDWSVDASGRFEPLDILVETYWDGFDERSLEGRIMEEIRRVGGGLVRFGMDLGEVGSDEPVDERDIDALAEMDEQLVALLETYILMLDRVVQFQALGELERQVGVLESQARNAELMAASGDMEALGERLPELDASVDAFQKAARDFDNGRLLALAEQWGGDLLRLSERIAEHVEAGESDAAATKMGWYADEVERLKDTLEAMQSDMEEMSEGDMEELKELIEEIERLEREERALLARTVEARETHGVGDDALIDAWGEAERLAQQVLDTSAAVQKELDDDADAWPREQRALKTAADYAERTLRAVVARDLDDAWMEAPTNEAAQRRAAKELDWSDRTRVGNNAEAQNTQRRAKLQSAQADAAQLAEVLDALRTMANQSTPALDKAVDGFAGVQDDLEQETRAIQPKAAEIASKMVTGVPGLEENLDAAVREMDRAEKAVARSWVVEAEGAEEAAADRLRAAIESLEQAAAAMDQMGDAMAGGGQGNPGEEGGGGEESSFTDNPWLELPVEDMSDEEYRQALMEGMRGEVPEEYEALKRRYYEELVRQ
ncbi:MAG: DUF4175 family protein [Proteobacteria bacterium]|nr:DUF4175 family protein [Pseudomonadota bacterium]MCP4921970.1 DUF4175 family protein [Pseudomonadota bacterium]